MEKEESGWDSSKSGMLESQKKESNGEWGGEGNYNQGRPQIWLWKREELRGIIERKGRKKNWHPGEREWIRNLGLMVRKRIHKGSKAAQGGGGEGKRVNR